MIGHLQYLLSYLGMFSLGILQNIDNGMCLPFLYKHLRFYMEKTRKVLKVQVNVKR